MKHECPSGLRGATQDRMAKASWVRTPLHAKFLFYTFRHLKRRLFYSL